MDLSIASLLEWTKLTVRDPRTASSLVKAAKLPLEVSVLMIVLAGVISGVTSGVLDYSVGSPPVVFEMPDGSTATFEPNGPLSQGVVAIAGGLALAYAIFWIGRRMGGRGTLQDIMAVVAILQMVMTVILIVQTVAVLLVPLLGLFLLVFGLYIFLRGLAHAVNEGHGFTSLGRSIWVIILSFVAVVFVAFLLVAVLGIAPQATIEGPTL